MDFIGPINPPSKKKQYIIVCTDYLTKWAKTKEIKLAIEEKVVELLRKNAFYNFWYPREWFRDQGNHFTSNTIEKLLIHHKINHRTSTPDYPQANGKVEVTNREVERILTKVVSSNRKDLVERLVEVTYAYNKTWKNTTRFTSIYGKKAFLSIEFEYNTLIMTSQLYLDLSHAEKERQF